MDIQLQDLLQIHWNKVEDSSPKYIVEYISSEKWRIINIDNLERTTIPITDGVPETGENSIVQVDILNRSDKLGYAAQNDLVPDVWVQISFDDAAPIKGKIFEKEEDMIVVKLALDNTALFDTQHWNIPDSEETDGLNDWAISPDEADTDLPIRRSRWDDSPEEGQTTTVYIDFKYEGLPDNVTIEIIDNPLLINIEPTAIEIKVKDAPIEFDIDFNPTDEAIELYQESRSSRRRTTV